MKQHTSTTEARSMLFVLLCVWPVLVVDTAPIDLVDGPVELARSPDRVSKTGQQLA